MSTIERSCVICQAEFKTRFQKQVYCSYDCYAIAASRRSAEYYRNLKKLRLPISKVCPTCHDYFETTRMKVKYCSEPCAHEAKLEKCKEYMQKLRDEYKAQNPLILEWECSLCFKKQPYRTKHGKYCDDCRPLARKLNRGAAPLVAGVFDQLQPGDTSMPAKASCFVCGLPAARDDMPCSNCNGGQDDRANNYNQKS